jgi:hydrogenase maturation protein HypF
MVDVGAPIAPSDTTAAAGIRRLRVEIHGAVQGVGFRPFVYRLATSLGLAGWVNNSSQGVCVEVEGCLQHLEAFVLRLTAERPPRALIYDQKATFLDPAGYRGFVVRHSNDAGAKTAFVLPDIAICPDCMHEIFDPADRRYRYPFTNCTNCGPRFSIIAALPYDRVNTTMQHFTMCSACQAEYENPLDRRFHAQPNCCPHCGPHLELWDRDGRLLAAHHEAVMRAADAIRCGAVVAVKGLGGFHLMVGAHDEQAVSRLRRRKAREEKPFALMFPTLAAIRGECDVSPTEADLLLSPEAPIVLLHRCFGGDPAFSNVAASVVLRNPYLGVLLPYTPLHHLLMAELGFPVVATSGNRSDEPICTDEYEALDRLHDIADYFLVHNRPILRHTDDSVARVLGGRPCVLRRARGYAPLPIHLNTAPSSEPILAVGGQLKSTIALALGSEAFVSQHIGDLETVEARDAFGRVAASLCALYDTAPSIVAHDMHPDYASTQYAVGSIQLSPLDRVLPTADCRLVPVQHHYAHVLACMAENDLRGPALGIAWDGTGYGLDGTIWGGEFLHVDETGFERAAHLRTFGLPGGEAAVREPRRSALGLLYQVFGDALFAMDDLPPLAACSAEERAILRVMLRRGLNTPLTSSVGRLFDVVAALLDLRQRSCFEGQAAMELEFAIGTNATDDSYPLRLFDQQTPAVVDWEPMIHALLDDMSHAVATSQLASKVHNTLVEMVIGVARHVGEERVVLSGGCFQNRYLCERAIQRLRMEGFRPYWHQRVPPNDGSIALGQLVAAKRQLAAGNRQLGLAGSRVLPNAD